MREEKNLSALNSSLSGDQNKEVKRMARKRTEGAEENMVDFEEDMKEAAAEEQAAAEPTEKAAEEQAAAETGEAKVTMSLAELKQLIAQEVEKAKGSAQPAKEQKAKKLFVKAAPAEKVKIKLFRDNGRYAKPVFVAVNGHKFIVPRGVEVEVPAYIAKVLDESFRQDMETADQLMQLERKFSEDTQKLK